MGAAVSARDGRVPPLEIDGSQLRGIEYRLPVASAQVKSCILLAGLLAAGETTVIEPGPTRDHTERMLRAAGARVAVEPAGTPVTIRGQLPGNRITVSPAERLDLGEVTVPADFSSAAFLLTARDPRPRQRGHRQRRRAQPDPHRTAGDPESDGSGPRGRGGARSGR